MGYLLISSIRAFPLLNILPILISSLLIQPAFSDDNYLYHICSTSSGNYTKGSNFDTNLKDTLAAVITNTTNNNGFGKTSRGQLGRDRAYALALCRGDVPTYEDCPFCLVQASNDITKRCPDKKAATIWREHCLLRYSDEDFFGQIDTGKSGLVWSWKNASDHQRFKVAAVGLLSNLSKKASDASNKLMFARGEILFDRAKNVKIYGMTQCTRDLSYGKCGKCLDAAVNMLPWNIKKAGRQYTSPVGGRTLTGSCYVIYDIHSFFRN